jgi:hypothetical protein
MSKRNDLPPGTVIQGLDGGDVLILQVPSTESISNLNSNTTTSTTDYQSLTDNEFDLGKEKKSDGGKSSGGTVCACCTVKRGLCISLLVILTMLVMGLLVKFSIGPAIVKSTMTSADVQFTSINVTDPTEGSVRMIINGVLKTTPTPYMKVVVTPVESYLWYAGSNMGKAQLDPITIDSSINPIHGDSIFVFDRATFINFARGLIYNDTVTNELRQTINVDIYFMGMNVMTLEGIEVQKEIKISGCAGLSDTKIQVFDLTQSSADTMVVKITAIVYNPSVMSLFPG